MRSYSMGLMPIQLPDFPMAHFGAGIIKRAAPALILSVGISTTTTFNHTWWYTFGIGLPNR